MRNTLQILFTAAAATAVLACGQTDTIIVDVSGTPDTLVVAGTVDTAVVTTADTTVNPPDTVVLTTFDTVFTPPDTVVVTVVDTLIGVAGDTTFVTTVDTLVTVDTVVVTRVDTVVTVDTLIVTDTINVTTTLVASVSTLTLRIGQTATLGVTAQNPLGFPSIPSQVTWISSAPSVASVSSSGVVRGQAIGSTNVFAVASGLSATIPTTVIDSATTPQPPPPPQGSWPNNEPTGMTRIMSTNGSDKYFGSNPTAPGWFYGGRWNDNTYVQAGIPDASSRYGTVIEKRMVVGDVAGWNGLAEYNWSSTAGVKRHLYVRAIFKYSSNYQFCAANEKMFYVGGPGGDGADSYIGVIGGNGSTYLANEFNGGGFNNIFFNYTITKGRYMTVEKYFVAESAPGSSDGEYYIWIDGVQVASATGQNWSSGAPGFSQIDLLVYWGGSSCTKTVNDVISISEVYVSGK
ncbi:MAG: hypothetical protein ABL963_05070 [Longimicrobiales bacterium]